MRILLAILLLFGARCFAASPVFIGTTLDYITNSGGRITFVWSNRVAVIFDRTNNNAGLGVFPTNTLDVAGHTSLRSNLFLPNRPTNAMPNALLGILNGLVVDTAIPSGGSTQLVAEAVGALTSTNAGVGGALPEAIGGIGLKIQRGLMSSNPASPNFMSETNAQLVIGRTNFAGGASNVAGIVLINPDPAPTNSVRWSPPIDSVAYPFINNGASSTNLYPVVFREAVVTTAGSSLSTKVWMTATNFMFTNGVWQQVGPWTTNATLTSAGDFDATSGLSRGVIINVGTQVTIGSANVIRWSASGAVNPGLWKSSGHIRVGGGSVAGGTNGLITEALLIGGPTAAILTNTLYASATLDFPSTLAQTDADLPITVTGALPGDIVSLGAPTIPLTGSTYTAFASNDTVWVRFSVYGLAAKDPASGTFKVQVNKFQ